MRFPYHFQLFSEYSQYLVLSPFSLQQSEMEDFYQKVTSRVCLTPSHLKTAPSVYLSTTSLTLIYWSSHSWSLFLTPSLPLLHLYLCINSWWFQNLYGWTLWSPSVRSFLSLLITCSSIPSQPVMLILYHHYLTKPEIIKSNHPFSGCHLLFFQLAFSSTHFIRILQPQWNIKTTDFTFHSPSTYFLFLFPL